MWSNEALNQLVNVRNKLKAQSIVFDPFFNSSDNIGALIQCVFCISSSDLNQILYYSNTEYVQCNWNIIFDAFHSSKRFFSINADLDVIIVGLLNIFTIEQLKEINAATVPDREYECYLSFLEGVIINNSELVTK